MRYVTATYPISLRDPSTDVVTPAVIQWADAVRALLQDPKFLQQLDVLDAVDLRKKLLAATPDSPAELSDGEWTVLSGIAKRPTTLTPAFVFSAEEFFRAILDAPTTK